MIRIANERKKKKNDRFYDSELKRDKDEPIKITAALLLQLLVNIYAVATHRLYHQAYLTFK